MKKLLSIMLVVMMLFTMAGCSKDNSSSTVDNATISGTFEGVSAGMQGTVKVNLTVEEGVIKNVELTEWHETPSVATVAMETIPAAMVEHNTIEVDVCTGATLASNAIMSATKKAAEAAGMDIDALKANAFHATAGEDETYDCDVVVVGAGGAGFAAAISAAEAGSKVIMVEKASFAGGNTLMQGGAFNAYDEKAQAERVMSVAERKTLDSYLALTTADEVLHFDQFPEWAEVLTNLQNDINAHLAANAGKEPGKDMPAYDSTYLHMWHIYTGGLRKMLDGKWVASDLALATTLAESAIDTYAWCVDSLGIEGAYGEGAGESLFTVLGAMWPRTHAFMTSTNLINKLTENASSRGVELMLSTPAKELIMNDGRVTGVVCERQGGTKVTINASKGVVLASGGYGANAPMAKQYDNYWGEDLSDRTLTTNVGTNKGDGITMAQAVGADTIGLDVIQLMPSSSPIKGTMTDGIWAGANEQIWIDKNGNRFVNEYAERDVLASSSLALEDGIFYILYAGVTNPETGMCEGSTLEDGLFGNTVQKMVDGGHIWYGSTLEELAEATKNPAGGSNVQFDADALRATIEKYNSYVDNQEDPDFGKEVISGKIDLEGIEADPTKGICISPRKASIHHTMGGVMINSNAEVIGTDGNVIAGLWAAGEVTGGIHAGNRLGGNAVADIFTFGHIAGQNAAK